MSGICAVWRKADRGTAAPTLGRIAGGLSISPGEQVSTEVDGDCGLAVSARFPSQQIYRNQRVLVACDADLVNQESLRQYGESAPKGLGIAGLLAELYDRFGCDFLNKLRGSFSLILWDMRNRKLVAALDGFAVKRLVYYENRHVLVVASRIDALRRAGIEDGGVNPRTIANLLNFTNPVAPETTFTRICRLLPGTLLLSSEGQTQIRPYWDMRYGVGGGTEGRLARELESVVEKSVADHCKGEPASELGAFLSGGTDSSTVVGMMDRLGLKPVQAFSIGFQEERFNELEYANIAASRFGAKHHKLLVGPDDCFQALPDLIRTFDEPFANSSAIPTYFCAKLAAENGAKVLLAGDGGDELFGGNERYLTDKVFGLYQKVPAPLRRHLVEPVLSRLPGAIPLVEKARNYVRRSNVPALDRFFSYHFLCAHAAEEVFASDFLAELGNYSVLDAPARYYRDAPARHHLDRLLYVDVKITLGDSDLPKVTCMSELAGIQVRFPFLDRAVAEFSGRVPARLKVKGFSKRYLFKRAFRNLLPPEIIRKKKHGFGLPVSGWLKSDRKLRELARDTLFSPHASGRGYFRRGFLEDLYRKYEADTSTYYGDTIWTFLILELWHRQAVDQPVGVGV